VPVRPATLFVNKAEIRGEPHATISWGADLVVDGGKIATMVDPGDRTYSADDEIDARGKHVLPGLVDAHVHFNDRGHAEREGYLTGTRVAAAGGVTTVIDMPLSCTPATTSLAALELKRAVAII
jgi:allantoinase